MRMTKITLTVLLAAAVLPQAAALLWCGPIGLGMVCVCLWTAGMAVWKLWRYPVTRRHLAGYCVAILLLAGLTWAAVPRLTFRQAQARTLALPENAAAEAVTQDWGDRLLSGAPETAKSRLLNKGYFVIVAEGAEQRSYFVHPATGAVYPNPIRQAGFLR